MNPTKTIVDQTEAALRLFFAESREDAARLLNMYGPLVRMFERDLDAAVEVRSLVLDRFPASEPPAVPGLDFLPAVEADAKQIVAATTAAGWDDDTSRCARCGTAYSPSYATHCVPCDGPMRVVSGGDEPKPAAPNVLLDATIAALPEPKPGQQYVDFEGDRWQVQSDGTLLWLDTRNINDRQLGLTKPNLLQLAKDWGPLTAGPLVEVQR